MMPPVLDDYSYVFTDTGVTLNADDNAPLAGAPVYDILSISGLDMGNVRTSMKISEGEDGGTVEAEFLDPRTIVIEGVLYCTSSDSIEVHLDLLKANYQPSVIDKPFYMKAPGVSQRVLFCKSLGVRYDVDQARRYNSCTFQIILHAQDPVIYGSVVKPITGGLSSDTWNGHSFNHGFNLSFGGSTILGNQITVVNEGTKAVGALITLYGPVTGPRLISETANKTLSMPDLNVPTSTDTAVIDLRKRTVHMNGQSRRFTVDSDEGWFLLLPGTNVLRYQATTTQPSQLQGTFSDGYF
jgi:hypothetical protein